MHHSASQWAGDNILSWRPDRGKKVFAHPNTDHDWNRLFRIVSKTHPGTKCVVLDEMQHFRGPRTPNLAPFSLSVRHRLSRPRATLVEKNRTEARPSPGTARRCTGAFRAERVPLHQQDSEIGRVGAQFARNRAWSGRGAHHSPGFSFWGSENIFHTLCTTVWENTRRGAKNPPALHFVPNILGGAGDALLWPRKIPSTTGGQRSCPARAFHRLHIGEAEIFSIVSMWRGRKIPGSGGSVERS